MRLGMLIDLRTCIGCHACSVACKAEYDVPLGVFRDTVKYVEDGKYPHAIEDFPVDPKSIYEVVVVANSTMRDIFFRQSVYSIGQNPYRSITEIEMAEGKRATTSLVETGRRSLLPIHPQARNGPSSRRSPVPV